MREQLGGRRLQFTDAQRRRLAAKAKDSRTPDLREMATIVTSSADIGTKPCSRAIGNTRSL